MTWIYLIILALAMALGVRVFETRRRRTILRDVADALELEVSTGDEGVEVTGTYRGYDVGIHTVERTRGRNSDTFLVYEVHLPGDVETFDRHVRARRDQERARGLATPYLGVEDGILLLEKDWTPDIDRIVEDLQYVVSVADEARTRESGVSSGREESSSSTTSSESGVIDLDVEDV